VTIIGIIPIQPRPATNSTNTFVTRYIFQTTNIGIVFMMFFVYSLQVAMFIILMAQIFSKRTSIIHIFLIYLKRIKYIFLAFTAKIVTILIWIASAINFYDTLTNSSIKYPLCIFPNMGLIFAWGTINQFERSLKTLDYSTLYTNIFNDTENLGAILAAMFGYTLLYIPIAWYVERISPGEYGVPLPFYFPIMVR
jgi:ATP-binding cassette subfamily A (ABC1) protein 3